MTQGFTRSEVTVANWMSAPYSRWSFQNVGEIVPSAIIRAKRRVEGSTKRLPPLSVPDVGGGEMPLEDFLMASGTDAFVLMHKGRIVGEWYAESCDPARPHIIFSVSKSLTGLLAGILAEMGLFSPEDPITRYVPEAAGSAYGDATVQQLLDMEISLDFEENYLDTSGIFNRYRRSTGWAPDYAYDPAPDLKTLLCSIPKGDGAHGMQHAYRSPNTDMAGIVLERAAGRCIADLMSDLFWRPLGAFSDASITVDRIGTARTAGGISVTPRDLARVGELVRVGGADIVSQAWISELWTGGSRETWAAGNQAQLFPGGSYRNYWYETGKGELAAIGIHGQWIWIDPAAEMVAVKLSSQILPVDQPLDVAIIAMLRRIAASL
jgi:CubicO group peptidase (beta-lactamase class C family)